MHGAPDDPPNDEDPALSSLSFDIDPHTVLGVPESASLEQIRDAYRRKSKMLHPDAGGEEWAFRVLVQSYETLSTARVRRAAIAETEGPRTAAPANRAGVPSSETLRGGIHDKAVAPRLQIAVEHLCVRYLWDDAAYLWLVQKTSDEERFLSCSLNLSWPDQVEGALLSEREAAPIVASLSDIFDHMVVSTRAITSRSHIDLTQFGGWLSYSSFDRSLKALKVLHEAARSRGLGLRQWSRDLFIPKNWK
jgi:hypothetical protein